MFGFWRYQLLSKSSPSNSILYTLMFIFQEDCTKVIYFIKTFQHEAIWVTSAIIIMLECSQALKICKCLWSLACVGVSNMLLVPSITFYCNYYIWGCMFLTDPFQFRWLNRYIQSSCCYHLQIRSINLNNCYHIFPWLCAWDVCYIMYCHLLHTFR